MFAGTLLTYLVVTVVPASAVTTCAAGPVPLSVQVTTDPDDRIILLGSVAVGWTVLEDGAAAPTACGPAGTVWLNVTGSDAGQETLVIYQGQTMGGAAITVSLGNGTDSLVLEYGDTTWNSSGGPVPLADPGLGQAMGFGTSGTGTVASLDAAGGPGELLVTNTENFTVNGGTGSDVVDAGNLIDITAGNPIPDPPGPGTTILDNIPASTTPLSANLIFNGEPGIDVFVSGNGNDTFNGGPDADIVSFITSSAGVTVDLAAGTGTGQGSDVLTDVQQVNGSLFADSITGSSIDNIIFGDAGPDIIDGGLGNDTETGGAGDDTFSQGATPNGADTIDGSFVCFAAGSAEVNGDWVDYSLRTTNTVVRVNSSPVSGQDANADGDAADTTDERDTIVTGTMENISTGSATDTIVGSAAGCEWMTPGAGNDTVDGASFADGADFDTLDESDQAGPSVMDISGLGPLGGPNGDATATLGTQVDKAKNIEGYSGTEEDDTLLWDGKALVAPPGGGVLHTQFAFRGYGGVDTVDASTATRGVTLDLDLLRPGATDDLENAIGGSGGDLLNGNTLNNGLTGNDGADTINGLGGNDTVEGGPGNDNMNGGLGGDTLSYRHSASGMEIDTQLGFATDHGQGGDGDDAASFFENVKGSDFDDTIIAGQTSVDFNNRLKGFKGDDTLTASNSSDTVSGGAGDDQLRLGGGDDTGKGGGGDDLILAGNGNDVLNGGKGVDTGNGQKGFDVCSSIKFETSCEA
ncbi:MAG TPA: hypothetical protein VJ259_00875 [Actinomycetota bacterium]|nr:hypothetical protein [Actinomycetota bacterium]